MAKVLALAYEVAYGSNIGNFDLVLRTNGCKATQHASWHAIEKAKTDDINMNSEVHNSNRRYSGSRQ